MLCGKTVALRPVRPTDLDRLVAWWNDPSFVDGAVGRWPVRPEEMQKRLARKPNYERRGEFMIVRGHSGGGPEETLLGHIGFHRPVPSPLCRGFEIGYSVAVEHRGHGYAAAAGRLLIDKLFNSQPVHRIQAHCRAGNEASRRTMDHLGMALEGTLRGFAFVGGRYEDAHLYSILRPEWGDSTAYAARFDGL